MDWVALSLISAVAFTAYTLLQKHALDRYVGAVTFTALAGMAHIGVAVAILITSPPDWFSWGVAAMALAGVIHVGIQLLSSYALRRTSDVSRIVPVLDAYPLFVMVMEVVWLGEEVTFFKWGAALLVMAGVMVASFAQTLPGNRLQINRSVLVFTASAGIALYTVLAKSASSEVSVWQMYAISWLFAFPGVMAAARVSGMGQVAAALRSKGALALVGLAQVVVVLAFWCGLTASTRGRYPSARQSCRLGRCFCCCG